jgi:hypothetical protein
MSFAARKFLATLEVSPSRCQSFFVMLLFVWVGVHQYIHVFPGDAVVRARACVFAVVIWKPFPVILGLSLNCCIAVSLWSFTHEIISTFVAQSLNNDEFYARYYVLVVLVHTLFLGMARTQHIFFRQLYDTQEHLQAEKEASEKLVARLRSEKEASAKLISMVCDGSVWLASDGDTVIQSEARLDAIVGHAVLNTCFSSLMSQPEQKRFWAAIHVKCQKYALPVRSLTTTLSNISTGGKVDVDLFIADRCEDMDEMSPSLHAPRYLVGVRLSGSFEPATAPEAKHFSVDAERMPVKSSAISRKDQDVSHTSFMSQTTRTFRVQSDVPRCVSFGAESSADPLETIETASSSSRASSRNYVARKGILRERSLHPTGQALGHCGPAVGHPFIESGKYLRDGSASLLEDLLSSWNFSVQGCCKWHANVHYLQSVLHDLRSLHKCSENWQPDVVWQCRTCTALHGGSHPDDSCWLCYAPRVVPPCNDMP